MKMIFTVAAAFAAAGCATMAPPPPPPIPPSAPSVANTQWRVHAVNGRLTPATGDYSMRFEQSRLGAKFGCNGMGADYVQRGDVIDTGPVIGTQMACADMSYERQGGAVLARDMHTVWQGPQALRLVNDAGSIDLRR